jgi:hypothetical protein
MGRDKPKKYNKMGYFQKQAYHDEMAKKYNINKDDFNTAQGGGGGRYDNLDESGYKQAIKNAMRNDFDYRTSAQHMDGVKGNAQMGDFTDYERAAVKLHKKAGNGGEYSSNKDITGVTNNLVKDDRRQQAKDFKDMYMSDMNAMRDKMEADANLNEKEEDYSYESSDEVAQAQDRLDKYQIDIGENNLFGKVNDEPARADDQKDAAASFASGYSADVKSAANLKENKARNLNNAMDTVKNSYRNQFM